MSKGYWIALYKKIENINNLGDYAKSATETIIKHGGKPIKLIQSFLLELEKIYEDLNRNQTNKIIVEWTKTSEYFFTFLKVSLL